MCYNTPVTNPNNPFKTGSFIHRKGWVFLHERLGGRCRIMEMWSNIQASPASVFPSVSADIVWVSAPQPSEHWPIPARGSPDTWSQFRLGKLPDAVLHIHIHGRFMLVIFRKSLWWQLCYFIFYHSHFKIELNGFHWKSTEFKPPADSLQTQGSMI